jgi:hypothetical protein
MKIPQTAAALLLLDLFHFGTTVPNC